MATPLRVQNIIASANLGKELNLIQLGSEIPEARYHATGTPAVRMHIEQPHAEALIFGNGKAVCSGTKVLADARQVMSEVKRAVKKVDKQINGRASVVIDNLVASMETGLSFDLYRTAGVLGPEGVEYNPMLFPGLVYRVKRPKATYILFDSGVLTISDVDSEADAYRAAKRFLDLMVKAKLIERSPPVKPEVVV